MQVKLSDWLLGLSQSLGADVAARVVLDEVNAAAARGGLPVDEYLNRCKVRGRFRRSVSESGIKDFKTLANCLMKLNIRLDLSFAPAPWDQWVPDSVLVTTIGVKPDPPGDSCLARGYLAERDCQAIDVLRHHELGIECRLETYRISTTASSTEAREQWNKLVHRSDVGAILVLGSEIVNPFASILVAHALDDTGLKELPARFRWNHDNQRRSPLLSEPNSCDSNQVGIRTLERGKTHFGRTLDCDTIPDESGSTGPIVDCGLLLIDWRRKPILVLAAGHGGNGTLGCVRALSERSDEIADHIQLGHDNRPQAPASIGQGRHLEVIKVELSKPTRNLIDDLKISHIEFGWDWDVD